MSDIKEYATEIAALAIIGTVLYQRKHSPNTV